MLFKRDASDLSSYELLKSPDPIYHLRFNFQLHVIICIRYRRREEYYISLLQSTLHEISGQEPYMDERTQFRFLNIKRRKRL